MSIYKTKKPYKNRRNFIKFCSKAASIGSLLPLLASARDDNTYQAFESVTLLDEDGIAIDPASMQVGVEKIFYYPLVSTPCFLIRLDQAVRGQVKLSTAVGKNYLWQGGVGPEQTVVAYSAICAHKMSHPSPVVSFIGYRKDRPAVLQSSNEKDPVAGVIQCCSEHSVYDPAQGAKVLSGPAPQPLAAIDLEYRDNKLVAKGVYGGQMFFAFIEKFGSRMELELERSDVAKRVDGSTVAVDSDKFSKQHIRCG